MFKVEYYCKNDGTSPVLEYVNSLDSKLKSKTIRAIDYLEIYGNKISPPYSKKLVDGIYELRVKFSSDIVRIIYFFYKDRIIVLTNGFTKKSQKTPKKEIELALKRKKEYERRN